MLERSAAAPRRPRIRWVRRLVATAAVAGLTVTLASLPAQPAEPLQVAAKRKECMSARPMQMVEANLRVGLSRAQVSADLARVFRTDPDFVALNEVAGRPDHLLTPDGYQIWRTPGKYTGANPVVWNAERWNATAQGTIYVSNQTGIPAGKKTHLGLRYANWVTLRAVDNCQTISVISYHVAPKGRTTTKLLIPSVHKIGGLVSQLAAEGPVLAAGDLNRHHGSRAYPRAELTSYGMTPTWDMTGRRLPTGDHQGATIDFIFVHDAAQFTVARQVTRELRSDHDAVVADLVFNPSVPVARASATFVRGHVVNIPTAARASKRAVLDRIIEAIDLTPKGAVIQVVSQRLGDRVLYRALANAHRRGVVVRIVTTNSSSTATERRLRSDLRSGGRTPRSWLLKRAHVPAANLPATTVLINRTADVRLLGIQVDQPLDQTMVTNTARGEFTLEVEDFRNLRAGFRRQVR